MTRANANQWFTDAKAANSIVPIARFVSPTIFAMKAGGYGCLFSLIGVDEEGLTDQELEAKIRAVEGGLRGLPEGSCLYQYMRVISGFTIPRQAKYADPITQSFVDDRLAFLDKSANFRRIDLHWCLTFEPKLINPLATKPKDQANENARLLADLQKAASILETHLSVHIGLTLLEKEKAFQFFCELFNLEEWAGATRLTGDTGVDQQIVSSAVSWQPDHLRVGKRYVQMFTMTGTPLTSQPCLFSSVANLSCDSVLCTTWRPKSAASVRKEIGAQEKWLDFFKVGIFQRIMAGKNFASLDTGAGAKAASGGVDDLGLVISELNKKAQGEYTVRLLLSARNAEELRDNSPLVHRIFVDAQASIVEETLGNLSAFYAMFPGNNKFSVFPLWLGEDHHARLSPVFAPHIGHPQSDDLDGEYLNVLETRQGTPFFQDVYVNGVRVMLIIGPPGTGKTTVLSSVREGAERSGYAVEGLAPTSRAAGQLREAGISATTLQSFLVRGSEEQGTADPASRHLYMLDESSLSSTRQMRSFLDRIGPNDRVLVIGDIRQHQGVDAGRPFEQMQDAGMRTSRLDQIMRQKDPELLKAVQHLSKGETAEGIRLLGEQGRITEISKSQDRIEAIAKDYATRPDNTIIISPDNRSRQLINQAVRVELQAAGTLAKDGQEFRTLVHRSDMTGADREWAARYQPGDVLKYTTGSRANGIERDSVATVVSTNARNNTLTVEREDGQSVTYDPRRLRGVNAYREVPREFATGERIQFTARDKELGVNNRDLGIIKKIENANITVLIDGKDQRMISFDPTKMRHFDHGYAVTSHSSQGLTEGRVIANIDTDSSRSLINSRLAYVAISRASEDARIYTNNAETLGARLATEVTKTAAVDFRQVASRHQQDAPRPTINQYADPSHRLAAVASAYAEKPDSTIVVAPDRAERRELNQLIRADLQAQGRLSPDSRLFTIHVEQTLSNPKVAAQYTHGDRIEYRQGSQSNGIANNSTVQVLAVDPKSNQLTVQTSTGDEITYSPHLARVMTAQSTVYRLDQREIALGERIQFGEGNLAQGIRKGDLGTVTALSTSNGLEVRLDRGSTVRVNEEQTQHIEHGYAVQNLKAGAPERILVSQEAVTIHLDLFLHSRNAREVSVYTSDGSGMSQAPITSRETLEHQQMEPALNVVAPEPMHVEHRRSIGR